MKEKKNNIKDELIELIELIKLIKKDEINEENLKKHKEEKIQNIFDDLIDENIFCIDLIDNSPFEFPNLFDSIQSAIKKNIKPCDIIIESIESFENINIIQRTKKINSNEKKSK